MSELSSAPWNDMEKAALNIRQADESKHPYTCKCGRDLVAYHSGWYCLHCKKIVQTWAHRSDIVDYRAFAEVAV